MSAKSFLYLRGRGSARFLRGKLSYTEERGKNNGVDRKNKQRGERMGMGTSHAGSDGVCGYPDDRPDRRFPDSAYRALDEKDDWRHF